MRSRSLVVWRRRRRRRRRRRMMQKRERSRRVVFVRGRGGRVRRVVLPF